MKLVNADRVEKATKLDLKGLNVATTGKWITLTGDASLVQTPNVNRKNDEKVTPVETEIMFDKDTAIVNLTAHSVNVIVLDLI